MSEVRIITVKEYLVIVQTTHDICRRSIGHEPSPREAMRWLRNSAFYPELPEEEFERLHDEMFLMVANVTGSH